MYIKSIRAQNFRCFSDLTVEFQKGLNVIIGENNSGKTALLRALGLVFQREGRRPLTRHDFYHGLVVDFSVPPSITVTLTLGSSDADTEADKALVATWLTKLDEQWEAQLTYRFFLPESYHNEFGDRWKAAVGTETERYWSAVESLLPKYVGRTFAGTTDAMIRADPEALATFEFQFLDAIRDAETQMMSGRSPLLRRMLGLVLDHAQDHREGETRTANEQLFRKDAAELVRQVKGRLDTGTLFQLIERTGAHAGGTLDLGGSVTERDLLAALSLLVSRANVELPISHNGLGYNNLIFVSLVLASLSFKGRDVEGDNEKLFPMLVVEEPEAHLHPALQYRLLKFMRERLENAEDRKAGSRQIFVTTHSTHVTAAAGLDALICLVADDGAVRAAYPGRVFGESKAGRNSKKYVERFLDATKSNMLFSKGVLFVEGMAEQQLIPCLAAYLGCPLEDHFATVISVDGLCFKHFLPLFGAGGDVDNRSHGIKRRVACLIDSDPARRAKSQDGAWRACWPYQIGEDLEAYDYQPQSASVLGLQAQCTEVDNVRVFVGSKTFEYDLAMANSDAPIIVTSACTFSAELEALASNSGAEHARLRTRAGNDAAASLDRLAASDEAAAIKARFATYYLASVEAKKGEHAFELERVLRLNLTAPAPEKKQFNVPQHIEDAIRWTCPGPKTM